MIDPKDNKALCPFSRTFAASPAVATCRGPDCALFRWETVTTAHPLWKEAVQKKGAELGEKVPFKEASAWVAENKVALGLVPTKGFCGAGGQP